MSEFICPVLISTDLAGRIFFLKAPCCDSEVSGGGGEGSLVSHFPRQTQQGPMRWEGGSRSLGSRVFVVCCSHVEACPLTDCSEGRGPVSRK